MEEQRRAKRTPIQMSLEVSSVFKQGNVRARHMHAPIEICNVSRNGFGFATESFLPIGYYFAAKLNFLQTGKSLKCVVRIVRQGKEEDGKYFYGCEFVGMAPIFDYIFDEIEGLDTGGLSLL